jgi:hypothetical protein
MSVRIISLATSGISEAFRRYLVRSIDRRRKCRQSLRLTRSGVATATLRFEPLSAPAVGKLASQFITQASVLSLAAAAFGIRSGFVSYIQLDDYEGSNQELDRILKSRNLLILQSR